MFFCGNCAKKEDWPESMFKSQGKCEICNKTAICSDVPSSHLPKRQVCEGHEGMIVMHAFSEANCAVCKMKVVTGHIPCNKVCNKCGEENNLCCTCGKNLN